MSEKVENPYLDEDLKRKEGNEDKKENVIEYYRPSFWKRCFIIIFDGLICALLALGSFIVLRSIVTSIPSYQEKVERLSDLKKESGIYKYSSEGKRFYDLVTFYNLSEDISYGAKKRYLVEGINTFHVFIKDFVTEDYYNEILTNYDEYRLGSTLIDSENNPYFIIQDGEIIENSNVVIASKDYYNVYADYIDNYLLGYFTTKIEEVVEITDMQSKWLIFFEVPLALTFSYTIIYLVIPLCFKRGKLTLGRFLFKTGLVDKNVLSVSWKRYIIRFLIMFFSEIVLSVFTFGVPLFVSFTLMAFSKKKQPFHDYMLGIEEVDTTNSKIYKNKEEIFIQTPKEVLKDYKMR